MAEAEGRPTERVRRAEASDEVILTGKGRADARLVPIRRVLEAGARRALLDRVRACVPADAASAPNAERSQDFLYGEDGLPR